VAGVARFGVRTALPYDDPMAEKITEHDREIFERKEVERERDRQLVAAGKASFAGMNRANAIAASVIHLYRPTKKRGVRR
jgi:hypothetical protein